MVVEPKTVQPIEPDKKLVDLFSSTSREEQIPFLSSRTLVQSVKVESQPVEVKPQPIKVQSRTGLGAVEI